MIKQGEVRWVEVFDCESRVCLGRLVCTNTVKHVEGITVPDCVSFVIVYVFKCGAGRNDCVTDNIYRVAHCHSKYLVRGWNGLRSSVTGSKGVCQFQAADALAIRRAEGEGKKAETYLRDGVGSSG